MLILVAPSEKRLFPSFAFPVTKPLQFGKFLLFALL